MNKLPEAYQSLYNKSITLLIPEARKLMMIADEMMVTDNNSVVLTDDRICVTINRATKTEVKEYLKSIN